MGPVEVKPTLRAEAKARRVSWETMKRAKTELHVISYQDERHWWWKLP